MQAANTFEVFDWLWTSGQLSEQDVRQLTGLGIEVVINLALPSSPNALPGEGELVSGLGLAYFQIPVVWEAPQVDQFVLFAGLLQALRGRKIWVHCAMNMRVSAFVFLYRRLILGEGEAEAAFPMRQVWSPDETWQAFMDDVRAFYAGRAG